MHLAAGRGARHRACPWAFLTHGRWGGRLLALGPRPSRTSAVGNAGPAARGAAAVAAEAEVEVATARRPSALARELAHARKRGDWRLVLETWLQAEGCEGSLDGEVCTIALGAMARGGLAASAVPLLRRMRSESLRPNHAAVGSALAACAAGGSWEQAFQLLAEVEGWRHGAGTVAYNVVIGACGHTRSADAALSVLVRMDERRVARSAVTYGAAIGACSRAFEWEAAVALLCDMRSPASASGVGVDFQAHAAAVTACSRAMAWRQALALVQRGARVEWGLKGAVSPAAHTAAIAACDRVGLWEQAVAVLAQMPEAGLRPATFSFNSALSACGRSSAWEAALALWRAMDGGPTPDWTTTGLVVRACERAGHWTAALALFAEMRGASVELGAAAHDAAIGACALGRRWSEALGLLRRMAEVRVPMTRTTRNSVLRACDGPERVAEATAALHLLHGGLGAASSQEWHRQSVPGHLALTEESLRNSASQIEFRMERGFAAEPMGRGPQGFAADEPRPQAAAPQGVQSGCAPAWPQAVRESLPGADAVLADAARLAIELETRAALADGSAQARSKTCAVRTPSVLER